MSNRLTKITTKGGDKGLTSLATGERVSKDHTRIHALGDVDELNSCIGMIKAELIETDLMFRLLEEVQHQLFEFGAELATATSRGKIAAFTEMLEEAIVTLNEPLPPLKEFILPGGSRTSACCHLARAVCRRAERSLVALIVSQDKQEESTATKNQGETDQAPEVGLQIYLNRLSDLLFIVARTIARSDTEKETQWGVGAETDLYGNLD
ncbi:MAG: cob(I)yrinic acid a,c-diamide adenosyltransferase [Pseudomonadales bacterium]|nr:cob(I)yrinic acid a,c-diamide adenosyltransferase [Pseudomonadales bacterium]